MRYDHLQKHLTTRRGHLRVEPEDREPGRRIYAVFLAVLAFASRRCSGTARTGGRRESSKTSDLSSSCEHLLLGESGDAQKAHGARFGPFHCLCVLARSVERSRTASRL